MTDKPILVFQHIDCEHPAYLRSCLAAANVDWTPVSLHRGEAIPRLEDYSALWVMGGPMDVWDVEDCPWLIPEKQAIRQWVQELKRPYLGLCLGHQLLADALGGTCGPQRPPELGILEIELTETGIADPLFQGLPARQKCLQGHGVRVAQVPENATVLASSELCPVQAIRVGETAWSMQYHLEIEDGTLDDWLEVPAYRQAFLDQAGEEGIAKMHAEAKANLTMFNQCANQLVSNFLAFLPT